MIIFIGDSPSSKNLDPEVPFVGTPSYKRLLEWIYRMDVDVNFVKTRNKDWVPQLAMLLTWYPHPIKVIGLGTEAQKELDKYKVTYFGLPHPSPRNRIFNGSKGKSLETELLAQCRSYIHDKNQRSTSEGIDRNALKRGIQGDNSDSRMPQ